MKFARRIFLIAGVYGLIVLLPLYVLEDRTGRDFPPPITHPEYYYGFIGVAVAWQVLFIMLASDPRRYRPMMIPAVLEKAAFGVAVVVLFLQNRVPFVMLVAGIPDLILGALFVAAFLKTPTERYLPIYEFPTMGRVQFETVPCVSFQFGRITTFCYCRNLNSLRVLCD